MKRISTLWLLAAIVLALNTVPAKAQGLLMPPAPPIADATSADFLDDVFSEEEAIRRATIVQRTIVKQKVVQQVQVVKQVQVIKQVQVQRVAVVQQAQLVTPFIPQTTVVQQQFATPAVQQFATAPCVQSFAAVAPSFQFSCGCPQSVAFVNQFATFTPFHQTAFFNGLTFNQQLQFATVGFNRGVGVNFFVGRGFGFSAGRAFRR